MVQMVPVDREGLAGKGWRRPKGYPFAAGDALIPIGASEFPHVASAMPIAFTEQSGRYMPVAVMSTNAGRNLFVGPQNEWLGSYIPAIYHAYPFGRGPREPGRPMTLCIDQDSGLTSKKVKRMPRGSLNPTASSRLFSVNWPSFCNALSRTSSVHNGSQRR